ncbi:helix-turn-helix transcriptional regulator [Clostridium hydrogeniformans]|uniref:helix-turn-helix transcriptional regulator n=1 Tax=Clostridium hydrogeniformans TaxID=349933 RepID=UPI0005598D05|nr:AraC family transcriptional regulator [Clostridium hydrogeniformans]
MEKFFLCTNIPIKAFNFNGELIHSIGYNNFLEDVFDNNGIYESLNIRTLNSEEHYVIDVPSLEGVSFTKFAVCPKNIHRGLYVIGPYASCSARHIGILYKPSCCMPHLISLLRNIAWDSNYMKQKRLISEPPYGLYVKKALSFIDARYNENITLNDVAEYLNITKCYFCTILKKETGKTFSRLINEIRIEKSKELLIKENLSILDISLSVGFNNQNYYSSMFKKLNNKTPIEFRNESLNSVVS